MDKAQLVASGHALHELLEKESIPPRAVMWVHSTETSTWKLWIVPHASVRDKMDFYRRVAAAIATNREAMHGIDASDVEMIARDHPAVTALGRMFHVGKGSDVSISNNMLDGFYLPEGIILFLDY